MLTIALLAITGSILFSSWFIGTDRLPGGIRFLIGLLGLSIGGLVGFIAAIFIGKEAPCYWVHPRRIELVGLVSRGSEPKYIVSSTDRKYWMLIGKSVDNQYYDILISVSTRKTEFKKTQGSAFLIMHLPRLQEPYSWLALTPNIRRYEIYLPVGGTGTQITRRAPEG